MQLLKKNLSSVLFAIGLLLFVTYHYSFLATPYFWDELGVYIPAAQHMNDAGTISLMPSSLDPLYSRGHPLLYTFLNASAFHFFGDRVVVAHALALLFALLMLLSLYYILSSLFTKRIALFSCWIVAVQPLFVAMSIVSLPEMCLSLFLLWAIWALIKEHWLLFAIMSSLAILTKESAIVIVGVAFSLVVIKLHLIDKRYSRQQIRWALLCATTPVFFYALFLGIQRIQNGWFFFPEHIGYLHFNIVGFFDTNWLMCKQFFFNKSNFIIGSAALVSLVYNLIYYKKANTFSFVVIAFIIISMFFANVNFYMQRYLLIILPWVVVLGVVAIDNALKMYLKVPSWRAPILWMVVVVSCGLAIIHWDSNTFNDTCDTSYRKTVSLVQQTADWLEGQAWNQQRIEANFPVYQALQEPRNGYVKTPFNIAVNFQEKCKYGIFFKTSGIWDPLTEHTYLKTLKLFKNDFAEVRVVQFY